MRRALILATLIPLAAVACAGEQEAGGGGGDTVNAELKDFSIAIDVSSLAAGSVTFVATNAGPSEHALEVFQTDLAPDALPVEDGKVAVDAPGLEEVGEIEEFPAGTTESATFDLTPGNYVLICNIPGHYQAGMAAGLEVG